MSNTLLISATKLEHHEDDIHGIPIHIVGVGKVESAINTTLLIQKYNPDIVINFGSCGSLSNYKVGEVLEVGTAVYDFDGAGTIDFEPIEFNKEAKKTCFTTDSFYHKDSSKYTDQYLRLIETCDVVDMEIYSIAVSCLLEEKSLYCYKWVSDDGDSTNWLENAALGFDNFKKILKEKFL